MLILFIQGYPEVTDPFNLQITSRNIKNYFILKNNLYGILKLHSAYNVL